MTSLSASEAIPVSLSRPRHPRGARGDGRGSPSASWPRRRACSRASSSARTPTAIRSTARWSRRLIVGVPVAVGLFAVRFPRERRFGLLLIGAGADLVAHRARVVAREPPLQRRARRRVADLPAADLPDAGVPGGSAGQRDRPPCCSARSPRSSPCSTSARRCSWRTTRRTPRGRRATPTARPTRSWCSTPSRRSWTDLVLPVRDLLGVLLLGAVTWWLRAACARRRAPSARRDRARCVVDEPRLARDAGGLPRDRGASRPTPTCSTTLGRIWSLCAPRASRPRFLRRPRCAGGSLFGDVLHASACALSRPRRRADGCARRWPRALDDPALDVLLPAPARDAGATCTGAASGRRRPSRAARR